MRRMQSFFYSFLKWSGIDENQDIFFFSPKYDLEMVDVSLSKLWIRICVSAHSHGTFDNKHIICVYIRYVECFFTIYFLMRCEIFTFIQQN